jgi:hypothetical protein
MRGRAFPLMKRLGLRQLYIFRTVLFAVQEKYTYELVFKMLHSLQLCHFCQAIMRGSHTNCLTAECLPSLSLVYLVPGFELSFCYKYCRFNPLTPDSNPSTQCAIPSSVACSATLNFYTLPHKQHDFLK